MSALRNRYDAVNFFDAARQGFTDNPSVGIYGLAAFVGQPEAATLPPGPVAIIDTVPGDTSTTATLTVDAAPTISAIDTIADEDFYQIALVAGHEYQVGMFGYTPQGPGDPVGPNGAPLLDSYIELYDSGGNLITSADGGSDTVLNSANSGFDALLTFTATTTGTYYVNARAFDNVPADGDNGDMTGDYGLYAEDVTDDPGVFTPYYSPDSPLYAIDWGTRVNKVNQSAANPDGDEGTRDTGNAQGTPTYGSSLDIPALAAAQGVDVTGKNVITIYFAQAGDIFVSSDPSSPGLPPATITAVGVQEFEHDAVVTALGEFSKVADIVYLEVDDRADADFIYTSYQGTPGPGVSLLGSMSPPDEPDEGLAQFNSGDSRWNAVDLQQGGFSFVTLIHEFGHGHGLAHPHDNGGHSGIMHGVEPEGAGVADYTTGDFHLNQGVFTMMSYEDGWQDSPYGNAPTSGGYGYLGGLMAFDIAAIQDKYGVNEEWATGDDVYTLRDVNAPGTYFTSIWDGGGTDSIVYSGSRDATIDLRPATLLYETGGGGRVSYAYGIYGGFTIANGVTIENAVGGAGDDTLVGNIAANVLDGAAGADRLAGGQGDDTYHFDNIGDRAVEKAGNGIDTVLSSVGLSMDAGVDNVTLTGNAAINATGNGLDNLMIGNSAANELDGFTGADEMRGGDGNDTYSVDNAGDVVVENANEGIDTIVSRNSLTLGANVENLTLIGTASMGTGNGLANVLLGNLLDNNLNGAGGADQMRGGAGDDTYFVDDAGDIVVEGFNNGTDTVNSSVGFTLGASVENLALTGSANINATGNGQDNTLLGNSGNNTLNGGTGADEMRGGAGDDTYVVDNLGDVVVEAAGNGSDTVNSSVTFTLSASVETLVLTGGSAISGTGNNGANAITGNGAANTLSGGIGADTLTGGGGADNLYGGTGHDDLSGGAGADRFRFDSALSASTNVDDILDFIVADDSLYLDRDIFTGIAADGTLAAGAFRAGTVALDADDRILYDNATGHIFYDADGLGGTAAILFATVTPGIALTSADFVGY